jgi:hypothetical protein
VNDAAKGAKAYTRGARLHYLQRAFFVTKSLSPPNQVTAPHSNKGLFHFTAHG